MNNIIQLPKIGEASIGYLSFFQTSDIGFDIKRIYYIYEAPEDTARGFHAHKHLQQLAWCPYGDITFILDDGFSKQSFRLNKTSEGLLIQKGIWHEMIWNKENSVLCVAASDVYNEDDYIRNYDDFIKHVKEGYWNE